MILRTNRLILREFHNNDCQMTLDYQLHPHFSNYYPWNTRTFTDVSTLIDQFIRWSKELPRTKFQLAIILNQENKLIGNCGVRKEKPDSDEAEFGCELDPSYWHQGYASEAGRTLLDFGFKTLGLRKIFLICVAENQGAVRLANSLNMKRDENWKEEKWMKNRSWEMRKYFIELLTP
jgi:RimJ/RimL family protein N-acetyltransferase